MNAKALTDHGAAVLVPDSELQDERFDQTVLELLGDEELRGNMRLASRQLGGNGAAKKLADQIEAMLGQR